MEHAFLKIAARAGVTIMSVRSANALGLSNKPDGSPVTEADRAADLTIREDLGNLFPEIPVVSEEDSDSHAIRAEEFFLVDPLDGTQGFISGRDDFTVNIAYINDRVPIVGVVHEPATGRIMCGVADRGLCAANVSADGSVSGRRKIQRVPVGKSVRVAVSRNADRQGEYGQFLRQFNVASLSYRSSSVKFCMIASGEADLFPRFGATMEWDTAAGHSLVLAAGGKVFDANGLDPLVYNKPGRLNRGFVACAEGVDLPKVW